MTRMASLGNFAGNSGRKTPSFAPATFNSARVGSNAGAAAGTDFASGYAALRNKAPKMDEIVNTADEINYGLDTAAMKAKAGLIGSGISGMGSAIRGKIQADVYDEQAQATEKAGMTSMLGGIAGGALSLATGGMGGGAAGLLGGLFG